MEKERFIEFIHGFNAGIGQSIIGHPLDTYKIWLQMKYTDVISIKTLYRGFTYPAFTNSIISGAAFNIYQTCKKNDSKYGMITGSFLAGITTGILSTFVEYKKISAQLKITSKFHIEGMYTLLLREIPACMCYYPIYDILKKHDVYPIIAGGIAGVTCWVSSYWADVLNTHVMSGKRLKTVITQLTIKDYFRGIMICIPRAFIINGCGYFFYETSKKLL